MTLNVLICHSSKSAGSLLHGYLGGENVFNVESFSCISDGIKCAFERNPNLIILGDYYEDGSTSEFIVRLKKAQITKNTPILVIQDEQSEQFVASCHDAGADGVLGCPLTREDFVKTVNLLVGSDESFSYNNYSIDKSLTILVVEDSLSYQNLYRECIKNIGCNSIFCENGQDAWRLLCGGVVVDLIITDIIMPVMDGKEFSALVRSDYQYNNIPLIVASTIEQLSILKDFFEIGVNDYFTKPFDDDVFSCRVRAHLHTRELIKNEEHLKTELASFNEKLKIKVEEKTQEIFDAHLEVINKLARVSEYKDDVTGLHIQRVRAYTEVLARSIGMSEEVVKAIGIGSIMHDVGKIAIPDAILKKTGKLTNEERQIMNQHPIFGEELFSDMPFFKEAKRIAGGHHEKWDGSGYPRQLKGEDIYIEARIVAISDVFDALLSPRPYKKAFTLEKSIRIISEGRGGHFDPMLVDCFLTLVNNGDIEKIMAKFPYE